MSNTNIPKVLFLNSNAVVIQCVLIPKMDRNHSKKEEEDAAYLEETICRPSCGYWKEAAERNRIAKDNSGGKKDFKLMCLHPDSPYLQLILDQLVKKGNL